MGFHLAQFTSFPRVFTWVTGVPPKIFFFPNTDIGVVALQLRVNSALNVGLWLHFGLLRHGDSDVLVSVMEPGLVNPVLTTLTL